MATIADIARRTGMGYSTVAQIMQGRSNYRADTIERVKAAARELGYVPNYLGKSLAGGKSMAIGICIENLLTDVANQLLFVLELRVRKLGYTTYLTSSSGLLADFISRRVDGLICHFTQPRGKALEEFFRQLTIPAVFIDRPILDECPATVELSYDDAMREVGKTLAAHGYRNVQLLSNTFFGQYPERLDIPYRAALAETGVKLQISDRWRCAWSPHSEAVAYDTVRANLAAGEIPEVLLCYNDHAALGAMAAIRDAGLRIPEDVGVVGRDGLPMTRYLRPSLATLARPSGAEIAEAATGMLLNMLNDPAFRPEPAKLMVRFETGDSLATQK